MSTEKILAQAEFNRSVRTYWLLSGIVLCVVTIVGILVLPIWLIVGNYFTERYLRNMKCVLTEKSLKVSRGILVRQEQSVPLDKITDLALIEGPIMRYLNLQALKIETAGQSGAGALVQLVGIVDARKFRDAVLTQRDLISNHQSSTPEAISAGPPQNDQVLLGEIRDALIRIERKLPEA